MENIIYVTEIVDTIKKLGKREISVYVSAKKQIKR